MENNEIKNDLQEIDVSPEITMYNLLESYPYDLGSALSEYIDNSLQAFLSNKDEISNEKVTININVDFSNINNKKIIIEDNGIGISGTDLDRAMKPAFKPEEQNLNEFGIGMKAASIWIGRKWTLINSFIDRDDPEQSQQIVFDLDDLIKNNMTSIPIKNLPQDPQKNGVKVIVENLNKDFSEDLIEDAFLTLEENYQYFINVDKTLDLHLNYSENKNLDKIPLEQLEIPPVLTSRKMIISRQQPFWTGERRVWKQDVAFEFNGLPVTGFVLCREKASQYNPGIKIFREKRLIQGTARNPYKPVKLVGTANKGMPSRFYAELHMDGQKISHTKGHLDINESLLLKTLQEQEGVQEILDQAENYKAIAANSGKVEEYTEEKTKKTSKSGNTKRESAKKKSTSKEVKPTDILDMVIKSTENLIVQTIAKEAKGLYVTSEWGFVFCYRVIAEKMIQDKIKSVLPEKYKEHNVADKAIVKLIGWLNNNKNHLNLDGEWQSLRRTLNHLHQSNIFDVTNLVSHGHYQPTKKDIDNLLANTQKLLEWAVHQE